MSNIPIAEVIYDHDGNVVEGVIVENKGILRTIQEWAEGLLNVKIQVYHVIRHEPSNEKFIIADFNTYRLVDWTNPRDFDYLLDDISPLEFYWGYGTTGELINTKEKVRINLNNNTAIII